MSTEAESPVVERWCLASFLGEGILSEESSLIFSSARVCLETFRSSKSKVSYFFRAIWSDFLVFSSVLRCILWLWGTDSTFVNVELEVCNGNAEFDFPSDLVGLDPVIADVAVLARVMCGDVGVEGIDGGVDEEGVEGVDIITSLLPSRLLELLR